MKNRINLLLLAFLVPFSYLHAQYTLLYQHTSDQYNWNNARAVADDGQGNSYLAGFFQNDLVLGPFTLTTQTASPGSYLQSGFIARYNQNSGSWMWAKSITLVPGSGAASYCRADITDIVVDAGNNIYITGEYAGTVKLDNITLTSTKQGSTPTIDLFVAKLSGSGDFLWAKSFGTKSGPDIGLSIALDPSGNILVGGVMTNKAVTCSSTGAEMSQYDIYLGKLNNNGSSLWAKRYSGTWSPCSPANYTYDVSVDGSGNAYITGQYSGTLSFGNGTTLSISSINTNSDVFAVKVNSSGSTQWVKSLGSTANDRGYSIYPDAAGNVYLGGNIGTAAFVNAYNASGVSTWSTNPFPGPSTYTWSTIYRMVPYQGALAVLDNRIGFKMLSTVNGSVLESDSIIGNINGMTIQLGTGYISLSDVDIAGSGFVFSANARCGFVTLENLTITASCSNTCSGCHAFGDIILAKNFGPPTIAPIDLNSHFTTPDLRSVQAFTDVVLYPNPSTDEFILSIPWLPDESIFLRVFDATGRVMMQQTQVTGDYRFGRELQPGVYYAELFQGTEHRLIPLTKMN